MGCGHDCVVAVLDSSRRSWLQRTFGDEVELVPAVVSPEAGVKGEGDGRRRASRPSEGRRRRQELSRSRRQLESRFCFC